MKCISLWQPWASLITAGIKIYETRTFKPPVALLGQRVAIHAAKKVDVTGKRLVKRIVTGWHGVDTINRFKNSPGGRKSLTADFGEGVRMPVGVVVATAKLSAAYKLGHTDGELAWVTECWTGDHNDDSLHVRSIPIDPWGDYSLGRWAWRLDDVESVFPPPAVRGRQGFFDMDAETLFADLELKSVLAP